MKLNNFLALLLIFSGFCVLAQRDTLIPKSIGWVNDFENILSDEEEFRLTKIVSNYEKKTTREIAIVTIDSFPNNMSLEEFSYKLAKTWGIGKKNHNNGILILVSKKQRKVRLEVGYGVENDLSDVICKEIINGMIPYFKEGNFYAGIETGLKEILSRWAF